MSFREKLAEIEQSQIRRRLRNQERKSLKPTLYFFSGQGRFLVWASGLFLIQIVEVAIIAAVHRVYFPPISTFGLRLVSGLSLLPIFLTLLIEFQNRALYQNRVQEASLLPRQQVLSWARVLFLVFSVVGFAVIAFFAVATDLHLSTPPIFRALLLSSFVSLPWDAVIVFLFLNLRSLGVYEIPRLRWVGVLSLVASLAALVANHSAIYLVLKLVPKIWISMLLWRALTRHPISALWSFSPLRVFRQIPIHTALRSRVIQSLGVFCALEFVFLFVTHSLLKGQTNWGFVLYFVTRMSHFGILLGARLQLKTPELSEHHSKFWTLAALTSLCLLPLLYLKREVVFWTLPTGESFEWNIALAGVVVGVALARVLVFFSVQRRVLSFVYEFHRMGWACVALVLFVILGLVWKDKSSGAWLGFWLGLEGLFLLGGCFVMRPRRSPLLGTTGPQLWPELGRVLTKHSSWALFRIPQAKWSRPAFVASQVESGISAFELRHGVWLLGGRDLENFCRAYRGRADYKIVNGEADPLQALFSGSAPWSHRLLDWPTYDARSCEQYLQAHTRPPEFWLRDPRHSHSARRMLRRVRLQGLNFPDASSVAKVLKDWVWYQNHDGSFRYLMPVDDKEHRQKLRAHCFDLGMKELGL